MNSNMRKMYTEKQLVDVVKNSGEISGGTQLYKHSFKITNEDMESIYCNLITNSSNEIDTTAKLKSAEIISGRIGVDQNKFGIFMGIEDSIYYSNQTSVSSFYLYNTETFSDDTVTPL